MNVVQWLIAILGSIATLWLCWFGFSFSLTTKGFHWSGTLNGFKSMFGNVEAYETPECVALKAEVATLRHDLNNAKMIVSLLKTSKGKS